MEIISNSAISSSLYNNHDFTIMSAIIGFLGALLGAFIGGIITHYSNKRNMKKDLQINACELMITKINIISSTIYESYLNLANIKMHLESYNEYISKNIPETSKTHSNIIKDRLESHEKNQHILKITMQDFFDTYESKEVILHDFKKIYNLLKKAIIFSSSGHLRFTRDFKDSILLQLKFGDPISDDLLNKIIKSWGICEITDVNNLKHLIDFKRELQNYYLSGLFKNYKIPKRIPEGQNDTILSIDDTQ